MMINYDDDCNHNDYHYSDVGGCNSCEYYKNGNSNENYDMHNMHNLYYVLR